MTPKWPKLRQKRTSASKLLVMFGVKAPPVPVFDIAGALHVEETSSEAVIWLRSEDLLTRQRWTLAHEIGHLLLHHPGPIFRDATFAGSVEETEANKYAANLLMPLQWVQSYLSVYSWDVVRVASIFQVSPQATRARADTLLGL